MSEKILYLTLKRKWFDLIKSGEKKTEFREIKEYWLKRLFNIKIEDNVKFASAKKFDYIIFTNGYAKNSPKIKVEWKGIGIEDFENKNHFAIKLGRVLEI